MPRVNLRAMGIRDAVLDARVRVDEVRVIGLLSGKVSAARVATRALLAAKSDRPWTNEECAALNELCKVLGVEVP